LFGDLKLKIIKGVQKIPHVNFFEHLLKKTYCNYSLWLSDFFSSYFAKIRPTIIKNP